MSQRDSSSPPGGDRPHVGQPKRRYDPVAPQLPLGRPRQLKTASPAPSPHRSGDAKVLHLHEPRGAGTHRTPPHPVAAPKGDHDSSGRGGAPETRHSEIIRTSTQALPGDLRSPVPAHPGDAQSRKATPVARGGHRREYVTPSLPGASRPDARVASTSGAAPAVTRKRDLSVASTSTPAATPPAAIAVPASDRPQAEPSRAGDPPRVPEGSASAAIGRHRSLGYAPADVPEPTAPAAPASPSGRAAGLPDVDDLTLPAAYADIERVARESKPVAQRPSARHSADTSEIVWPPRAEDLDAVEVLALDDGPPPPRRLEWPPVAPGGADAKPATTVGAEFVGRVTPARPASARVEVSIARPVERVVARAVAPDVPPFAWPPSPEEVDAVEVIDMSAAIGAAPTQEGPQSEPALGAERDEPRRRRSPKAPWLASLLVLGTVAGAATYLGTRDAAQTDIDPPPAASLAPASAPSAVSADVPAAVGTSGVGDSGGAAPAVPVEASVSVPSVPEAARHALARGDRLGALRTALAAGPEPDITSFVDLVVRGAARDAGVARSAVQSRVAGSDAVASFQSARAFEINAMAAWRRGEYERSLDLFDRATRGYVSVKAGEAAAKPRPVPGALPPAATAVRTTPPATVAPPVRPATPGPAQTVPRATAGAAAAPRHDETVAERVASPSAAELPAGPGATDRRTVAPVTPPTLEARPPATPRADDAGVRRAIDAYRTAYGRLDAPAAKAVVPSIDARALAHAFSGLSSQRLDFDRCDVSLRETRATATCVGRAASVPRIGSGKERVDSRRWDFQLERRGEQWVMTSAKVSQR